MTPEFRPVSSFPRGTLYSLLRDAYGFDRRFALHWEAEWRNFDGFFFDRPAIADRCGFVSVWDGEAVGFVSWDPREAPACVKIGHNCIAASCKGRGWGTAQMSEAVQRARMGDGPDVRGREKNFFPLEPGNNHCHHN